MSANEYGTDYDRQLVSLLDNEVDMNDRTHSESIEEHEEQMLYPAAGTDQKIPNMTGDQNQQNDEDDDGTMSNEDETDRGKSQMMFVVLISIMLVLVALTFSQSLSPFLIKKPESPSPTSQGILIVYMLAGLLIIVAMFICKHKITEESTDTKRREASGRIGFILRNYLSIVGMSFFFPFACILDFSYIIAEGGCNEIWKLCGDECYREYVEDMFYHLIRILFMGAELAFCCKFHGTRLTEHGLVRCGLMIVMAANLGLWFLSLINEASDEDGEAITKKCLNESGHMQIHKTPENWHACVNKTSSAHQVMRFMSRYMYPFAVEFSLLVGEFLLTKFVSSTKRTAVGPVRGSQNTRDHEDSAQHRQPSEKIAIGSQPLSTSGDQCLDQPNQAVPSGHQGTQLEQLISVFIIAIGLFASFLYISLMFIDWFARDRNPNETDSVDWRKYYKIYSLIYCVVVNILVVVGYASGYGLTVKAKTLHGLDWLVLISAIGPFMRELINLTAVGVAYTDLSPNDFPAILICTGVVNLVQLILQTPFIFLSERWYLAQRQQSQPRYRCQEKILRAIVFCLAVTNLVNWINDSIMLTSSFSVRNDLLAPFVDKNNWRMVEHITLPLLIFFRFNSFLLFTRAYLGA